MKFKSDGCRMALLWFGAGVSIAEMLTGTYFAPLGFAKGVCAVIVGHVIGCALLFFAGYMGAMRKKSAMETSKISFGVAGSAFFAFLNVLQLAGWTGIMVYDGAMCADGIFPFGRWMWAVLIGALIVLWIVTGVLRESRLGTVSLAALFVLTLILCKTIFFGGGASVFSFAQEETMRFGAAVELAAAMPISWLPLIGDYTKDSSRPLASSLVSAGVYGITSCWMYVIGMGAALFTGESDIAQIMLKSGLGFGALAIIVLSTVTTTFLDAYSAGISFETIVPRANGKRVAVVVAAAGTLGAIFLPMDDITGFLYLIGSVFAPMIAVLCADFFVLKSDSSKAAFNVRNGVLWLFGFILYRISLGWNFFFGNTVLVMAIVFAATVAVGKILPERR